MKDTKRSNRPRRISIKTVELKISRAQELANKSGISPDAAREILQKAVKSISDKDLKNFRGGQILLVA